MSTQIALQLYTLRDFCKTPADIAKTLARVKQIGYDAVQASALGPIDDAHLAKILKGEGLTCCATHVGFEDLRDRTSAMIDKHHTLGCSLTAIGGWGWNDVDAAGWKTFACEFSAVAAKFKDSGLSIGYHNHSHELVKFGGVAALDILFNNFSDDVWMEVDTYWITHGGGDPAAWIEKYSGRVPAIHLKDMGMSADKKQQMREIGEGNLNFAHILATARKAGTNWFIIEQDNCNGMDPFECVERSLKNLKAMGME